MGEASEDMLADVLEFAKGILPDHEYDDSDESTTLRWFKSNPGRSLVLILRPQKEMVLLLTKPGAEKGWMIYEPITKLAEELQAARATLSRQAELLAAAKIALGPFARGAEGGIQYVSQIWTGTRQAPVTQGDLRTASTTYDAIRAELKGDANGE